MGRTKEYMKKNSGRIIGIGILAVAAITLVAVMFMLNQKDKQNVAVVRKEPETQTVVSEDGQGATDYSSITYQGERYIYRKNLKTILFLGIDKNQDEVDPDHVGTEGRSDCMILFLVNTDDNTAQMLAIPRETMVDVEIYTMNGEYFSTQNEQITLQHAYGDSEKKSCWLTKKAVSKLMDNIPIDAYLSMQLEGVADITNLIGGVTLTMQKDYTYIDPAFSEGATVNLQGELAQKFVRTRDTTVFASNEDRMDRQSQFIKAMVPQLKMGAADVQTFLNETSDYLTTDMDVDEIKSLINCSLNDETLTIPGERVSTGDDTPEEYYVDDDALTRMIIELCYEKVE